MDRRSFLSAGIAIGGAELLLAQETPKPQKPAAEKTKTEPKAAARDACTIPAGGWTNVGKDANNPTIRRACLRVLRMSSIKYIGFPELLPEGEEGEDPSHQLNKHGLKDKLENEFPSSNAKTLDLWAYFEDTTPKPKKLVMLMGITWKEFDGSKRKKPHLRTIGLNGKYFPVTSDQCELDRAKSAATEMYTHLKKPAVADSQNVKLYIANRIPFIPMLRLVNAARVAIGVKLIGDEALPDGTRIWTFETTA